MYSAMKEIARSQRQSYESKLHLVHGRLTAIRRPAYMPAPAEDKVLEADDKAKKAKRELRDSARPCAPAHLPQLLWDRL